MAVMDLPHFVTDQTVTPEWLNAKLGITTIESIKAQRIGEDTGHTDLVYRIELTHRNNINGRFISDKLRTVVMKVMDASEGHRMAFEPLNSREVRFYTDIAPLLNLEFIPTCYYADFDKEMLKGTILLEDAGKAIHKGELQTATAEQAKRAMLELARFHGKSLAKWSEIPIDLPRPLEADGEAIRKAFPIFAETWAPYLGEEGLKRYERAVDAYEKKWLAQKDSFVQGLVHGDYRIGNVIFGSEELVDTAQGLVDQSVNARDYAENIKASIAQRHSTKEQAGPEAMPEAMPEVSQANSNKTVVGAGNGYVKASTDAQHNGNPSQVNEGSIQTIGDAHQINRTASEGSNPVLPVRETIPQTNGTNGFTNGTSETSSSARRSSPAPTNPSSADISSLKFRCVDFQTLSRGPIFFDVAYFLAISLDTTTRHSCEFDLVHAYYTALRETAGAAFPANLNMARVVHEISVGTIKAVVASVTTLNRMKAPEMAMKMVGGRLNSVADILEDWRSLD